MKTTTPNQTIYPSNSTFIVVGFVIAASFGISIIALSEFRFTSNLFFYPIIVSIFGLFVYYKFSTYLTLTAENLVSRGFLFYIVAKSTMSLNDVDMVRRIRPGLFWGFGDSFITVFAKDGTQIRIHEAYYDVTTLKDFLTNLKSRRPWIEFDQQYIDLIEGKIPCDESFRKLLPKHTVFFSDELFDRYFS